MYFRKFDFNLNKLLNYYSQLFSNKVFNEMQK